MPGIVWKGYVSFGLVSFPVQLHAAARPESIHFHMLHAKDHARIKEVWYCSEEDKPVNRKEIVKGYEYSKGEYVIVDDEDLKKIAPKTARAMEILQFVKVDEVDPIFFDKSYYMVPDAAVSKPYALLLKAMTDTNYVAVAKLAMHNREHIVIIRPGDTGLLLHTMYFVDELHKAKAGPRTTGKQFAAKEVELAKKLIETLASPFQPEHFHDEYRKNVEQLIDRKRHGKTVTAVKQPAMKPVVDIMQALQQSLSAAGKTRTKTSKKKKAA